MKLFFQIKLGLFMKISHIKLIVLTLLIFYSIKTTNAQTNEIHLYNKPSEVTVYSSGAIANYTYTLNLKKGYNKVYLDSMPKELNKNLIYTNINNKNLIFSTEYLKNINDKTKITKLEQKIKDSIEACEIKLEEVSVIIEGSMKEKQILADFKYEQKSEKVNQLKELLETSPSFGKRIIELRREINKQERIQSELKNEIEKLEQHLFELEKSNQISNEYAIILEINSESNNTAELNLKYFTAKASWNLTYDIRVSKKNEPINLVYKAMLNQKSGINWENVKLTLSNRNPTIGSNLPVLTPWVLRYQNTDMDKRELQSAMSELGITKSIESGVISSVTSYKIRGARDTERITYSTINSNNMNVEYKLPSLYNVSSNDQYYNIIVDNKSINADYGHYTVPSLALEAYLTAKITDWSKLNLISGSASIYYEDAYIGSTNIDPNQVKDTLEFSLGVDKNITIKRKVSDEMEESKFMSSDNVQFRGYTIKVKNNSKNKVLVKIIEKFPISKNEKIKVELLETSSAKRDSKNGFLAWYKSLDSNKGEEMKMIFKVEAPEGFELEDEE